MWQYTTETIINSNKGNLAGGKRAVVLSKNGAVKTDDFDSNDTLLIDGVGSYLLKYITHMTKYEFQEAKNEIIVLPDLTDAKIATDPERYAAKGEVLRLSVKVRQEGLVSSIYQNAYLRHNKPFEVEVLSTETPATDATALADAMNKMLGMSDFKFFTATADNGVITLTAEDCYARFVEARIDVVPNKTDDLGAILTGYKDYSELVSWVPATGTYTQHGTEGNGTVTRLIKNLRIPTNASINPFAADHGGMPVPGGEYDQYLIEYETPRHHVAGGVMGSVGEISRTSHVLFLEKTYAAEVATLLAKVAEVEPIIDEVNDPVQPVTSPVEARKPGSVQ